MGWRPLLWVCHAFSLPLLAVGIAVQGKLSKEFSCKVLPLAIWDSIVYAVFAPSPLDECSGGVSNCSIFRLLSLHTPWWLHVGTALSEGFLRETVLFFTLGI